MTSLLVLAVSNIFKREDVFGLVIMPYKAYRHTARPHIGACLPTSMDSYPESLQIVTAKPYLIIFAFPLVLVQTATHSAGHHTHLHTTTSSDARF